MIKRRKREKMGLREETRIRSPGHLKWVRGHVCAIMGIGCCVGRTQSAHVRTATDGGTGIKPSDCYVIPLCEYHHSIQHDIGERAFEDRYSLGMKKTAMELWSRSPHRIKYEQRKKG